MTPPFPLNPPGSPATRGWGPGWPVDRRKETARIICGDVTLWVHHAIAPIVAWLVERTEAHGYPLVTGWCWGYCCRAIRGSNRPSNHSWGLAVDINAPKNPMSDRLVTDMPPWMIELWNDWGFRWGGHYGGRKDAMHFEFMGTPADAKALIAELSGRKPIPSRQPIAIIEEAVMAINAPATAIAATTTGKGYWLFADDGGVFCYGDARFFGSLADRRLNAPVVGGVGTPDDSGYWMASADGGVFAFGNAGAFGSMGDRHLNFPVVGITRAPDGQGYWLVAEDGGVFAFGSAAPFGSPA